MPSLTGKKAAMIIGFRDFRDEEYFIPKQVLEEAGIKIITVSSKSGTAVGIQGGEAKVDALLEDVKPEDYDVILFVGGSGALKYQDDENCHRIIKEAAAAKKILAAICIAPVILAKAGALQGKKATVWNSAMDKSAVKTLEENGAIFVQNPVVVDGTIVTASGPDWAKEFADEIITLLSKNQ